MNAPRAARKPHAETRHEITRHDPYHWLRDPRWQEVLSDPSLLDPEIRAYLEAENAHTQAALAETDALQEALIAELRGRLDEDESTVPAPDGEWAYFRRFSEGKEYPIICRQPAAGGEAEVLLDVNQVAEGREFCAVSGISQSPDHAHLAYAADFHGSGRSAIHVRRLADSAEADVIPDAGWGGAVWIDAQRFGYVELDEHHRPKRVKLHQLGGPIATEPIHEEPNDGMFLGLGRSESRRFLVMSSADHTSSELWAIDTQAPQLTPRLVLAREPERMAELSHHGEHFYLQVSAPGTENGRIVRMPIDGGEWEEVVAHRPSVLLRQMVLLERWLVRLEREDALPRLVIRELASGEEHAVTFDEAAYELDLVRGDEFDSDTLRFRYSSMTTPAEVYDYQMSTRQRTLRKQQRVPSGHDPAQYVCERRMVRARDGEMVPLTMLRRADLPAGPAPTLQYGYGSYGMAMPVSFSPHRLSLVDRGFIYAIAHIRGGKEKGHGWYTSAKKQHKTRTFDDFIDVARHLTDEGITTPELLTAEGRSAGGMLIGAVANRAPDQFAALVAGVPFVDVLNTMCDATLPLTPPEWPEWGNPLEDAEAYRYISAYSPYDNIAERPYPAILIQSGLTDSRVTYWEPAKWIARLRHRLEGLQPAERPLLLDMEMGAGHGGASGRFQRLRTTAQTYAFLIKVLDLPLR